MKNYSCKYCVVRNHCQYKTKAVEGYTIFTTENCCKNEVETTLRIINTDEYKKFILMLESVENSCKNLELLKKNLKHFENIGKNILVTKA